MCDTTLLFLPGDINFARDATLLPERLVKSLRNKEDKNLFLFLARAEH